MQGVLEHCHVEFLADLAIVWIGISEPFAMLSPELCPNPISEVAIKQTARMEPIALLDHHLWVAAFEHPPS